MDPRLAAIGRHHADLTAIRHDLHRHPELGYEETRTAALVADELRRCGVDEIHTGIGRTGVVGVIHGRHDGDGSIGLRADMDAIPIDEKNDFGHRSTLAGKMHGCGHDGHTTMLLGAARYLAETRNFTGRVHVIFQPGEEGHAGARAMIQDGLFERFPVSSVFALHNWPSLPAGTIGINPGPMMAGIDVFRLRVAGVGGHGAHPHQTVDPIIASAHVLTALQTIVSRNVNPLQSAVISFHHLQAGSPTALSVIPDAVETAGIVKWYAATVQELVERRLGEVAGQAAAALGARAEVTYDKLYPPTINDPAEAARVVRLATGLFGADRVVADMEPSMGSEDFAFMLQAKPGAYFRLGTGARAGAFLHSPHYDFNDAVIPVGAALFAAIAEDALAPARPAS